MLVVNDMKRLGQTVERAMAAQGIAAYELAAKIGRVPSWVSRFLNGDMKNMPDPYTLRRISSAVGVSMHTLLKAAGYIEEADAPGDVITIRRDDPRAALLDVTRDLPDASVDRMITLFESVQGILDDNRNRQRDVTAGQNNNDGVASIRDSGKSSSA